LKVIRPDSDCLASVLIVDSKFSVFEDIWRFKDGLRIEVLIDRYVRFLLSEAGLYKHFTIKDISALQSYHSSETPESLAKVYPYYTRDVVLAQTIEILRADALGLRPTEITYISPESSAANFKSCFIPTSYIEHGRSLLATELAFRGFTKPLAVSKPRVMRMRYCFASYAYSEIAINKALPSWNMDE